jgi:hypothetical protein
MSLCNIQLIVSSCRGEIFLLFGSGTIFLGAYDIMLVPPQVRNRDDHSLKSINL